MNDLDIWISFVKLFDVINYVVNCSSSLQGEEHSKPNPFEMEILCFALKTIFTGVKLLKYEKHCFGGFLNGNEFEYLESNVFKLFSNKETK